MTHSYSSANSKGEYTAAQSQSTSISRRPITGPWGWSAEILLIFDENVTLPLTGPLCPLNFCPTLPLHYTVCFSSFPPFLPSSGRKAVAVFLPQTNNIDRPTNHSLLLTKLTILSSKYSWCCTVSCTVVQFLKIIEFKFVHKVCIIK